MRRHIWIFAALLGFVLTAAPANAQSRSDWSGLYIGANAGWAGYDYSAALQGFPGNFVSGDDDGMMAGLHLGLQHQFNQFVLGVEGSFNGFAAFNGHSDRRQGGTTDCLIAGPTLGCESRLHNFSTLGLRAGWTPTQAILIYGTAGWANGRFSDRVTTDPGQIVGASSARHDGLFFGGGIEYALSRNWIIGVEYLHFDFNDRFHCDSVVPGGCTAGESRRASTEMDVVRARLTFKLGRGDDPEPLK